MMIGGAFYNCPPAEPLLSKKGVNMDKLSKFLFVLWIVLAIAAFIGAFWATPAIVRTLSIIFGIINMMIIMSWVSALIREKREIKKQKEKESD